VSQRASTPKNQPTPKEAKIRKLIVSNNVTLDGRVDEVRDWALGGDDEGFVKHHTDLLSHSDGLLLGRKSYEFFAAVWPSRSGEFPDRMNSIAKYVASSTLKDPEWENSHLIEGDVPAAVAKLKQEPGQDLVVYGSLALAHSLLEQDLIDEYQLWVHPVVLGKGRTFFKDGLERMDLDLVDTTVIPPGVVILTYQPKR
jgi:dihydrofolate reductase